MGMDSVGQAGGIGVGFLVLGGHFDKEARAKKEGLGFLVLGGHSRQEAWAMIYLHLLWPQFCFLQHFEQISEHSFS